MPFEFHLFRGKFIRPYQLSLFDEEQSPTSLFLKSLAQRPAATFRRNYTWHIGMPHEFDATSGYFAIGRNSPTSIPRWDPDSGDFIDTDDITGPYTLVVYDAALGLMVIQRQTNLAPATEEIASKLERLLRKTDIIRQSEVDIQIDPIPDPEGFIERVESAYSIKKFTAKFTGPNPIDADELFQKPLSVYLNAANGTRGTTAIQGRNLSSDVVAAVARSTAATGNTASARVQDAPGKPIISINLGGNPVKVAYEDQPEAKQVLEDARTKYRAVRHE